MPKLRVLIVDDSAVVRRVLSDTLSQDPDIEVHAAPHGRVALSKIPQVNPDLVTLDIEMPELDGLATLKEIRKGYPKLPVIMFSTLTERGASTTLDALAAGANDYVTKPSNTGHITEAMTRIREELIPKIKALCGRAATARTAAPAAPAGSARRGPIDIVAIGVSTGGPNALSQVLPMLPATLAVPVVIVQHMPPVFTKLLADRLHAQCSLPVREGVSGALLKPGEIVIAAGGEHMLLERPEPGAPARIRTNTEPPENSCRPAVDVLFRSVASLYGARALGVILTGMGSDGLRGCEHLSEAGGQIIVQDEPTSVVWGMPGYVARAGLAEKVLPLSMIAPEIARRAAEGRAPRAPRAAAAA